MRKRLYKERGEPVDPNLKAWTVKNTSALSAGSPWRRSSGGTRLWASGCRYGGPGRAGTPSAGLSLAPPVPPAPPAPLVSRRPGRGRSVSTRLAGPPSGSVAHPAVAPRLTVLRHWRRPRRRPGIGNRGPGARRRARGGRPPTGSTPPRRNRVPWTTVPPRPLSVRWLLPKAAWTAVLLIITAAYLALFAVAARSWRQRTGVALRFDVPPKRATVPLAIGCPCCWRGRPGCSAPPARHGGSPPPRLSSRSTHPFVWSTHPFVYEMRPAGVGPAVLGQAER